MRKPWKFTPEIVQTVLDLRKDGKYVDEIVQEVNRLHNVEVTAGGVNKVLRTRGRTSDPNWTSEMEARLKQFSRQGFTRKQIAEKISQEFNREIGPDAITVAKSRLAIKDRVFPVWNAEISNKLRDLYDQGLTHNQIADRLNEEFGTEFDRGAINQHALELGIANRNEGDVEWTKEMKQIVRDSKAKSETRQQTADKILESTGVNVSPSSVGATVSRLGVQIGLHEGVRRLWTPPVEATLVKHWNDGKSAEEISSQIKREHGIDVTAESIMQQCARLELKRRDFVDWDLLWPTVIRGLEQGDRPHQILEEIKTRHGLEISRLALYGKLHRFRRTKPVKSKTPIRVIVSPARKEASSEQAIKRFGIALETFGSQMGQVDERRPIEQFGLTQKINNFLRRNQITQIGHMVRLSVEHVSTELGQGKLKPYEIERLAHALESSLPDTASNLNPQSERFTIPKNWESTVSKFAGFQQKIRAAFQKMPPESGAEHIPTNMLTTHPGLQQALGELGLTRLSDVVNINPRELASLAEKHGFKKTDMDELREGTRTHVVTLLRRHGFME